MKFLGLASRDTVLYRLYRPGSCVVRYDGWGEAEFRAGGMRRGGGRGVGYKTGAGVTLDGIGLGSAFGGSRLLSADGCAVRHDANSGVSVPGCSIRGRLGGLYNVLLVARSTGRGFAKLVNVLCTVSQLKERSALGVLGSTNCRIETGKISIVARQRSIGKGRVGFRILALMDLASRIRNGVRVRSEGSCGGVLGRVKRMTPRCERSSPSYNVVILYITTLIVAGLTTNSESNLATIVEETGGMLEGRVGQCGKLVPGSVTGDFCRMFRGRPRCVSMFMRFNVTRSSAEKNDEIRKVFTKLFVGTCKTNRIVLE